MKYDMKKTYIAPEITVIEMEIESPILSISGESGGLDDTSWGGSAGSSTGNGKIEADANRRRGSWGNLWESDNRW